MLACSTVTVMEIPRFLPGPVLAPFVTDTAQDQLPAFQWTPQYLVSILGDTEIRVKAALESELEKRVPFDQYCDWSFSSDKDLELGGVYTGHSSMLLNDGYKPEGEMYMVGWNPGIRFPELARDIMVPRELQRILSPHDLLSRARGFIQELITRSAHLWVFVGPTGTVSQPHADHHGVHTYLAQIVGQKKVSLWHPLLDPEIDAPSYTGIIDKGDLLFIPSRWKHGVVSLSPSITVSRDMVDMRNLWEFVNGLLVQDLPAFANLINRVPDDERVKHGIRWKDPVFSILEGYRDFIL